MTSAPERISVLILEDDAAFAATLEDELGSRGHLVETTSSVAQARERLRDGGSTSLSWTCSCPTAVAWRC